MCGIANRGQEEGESKGRWAEPPQREPSERVNKGSGPKEGKTERVRVRDRQRSMGEGERCWTLEA